MALHPSTFDYLRPNAEQLALMNDLRIDAKRYAAKIAAALPDGADKTYILRRIRETAMWINVAVTREADGTPRP